MNSRPNFFLILIVSLLLSACAVQRSRINGVSFVAQSQPVDTTHVRPIHLVNANYAAIMPFGFIQNTSHPQVYYNTDRQWFGETVDGVAQYVGALRKEGIEVMLKPQIWIWQGAYTGTLQMATEDDWKRLEDSYAEFILTYARQAELLKIPIFCIGTELEKFVEARPEYWNELIGRIRASYSGKLTYAANWDEYKRVHFWEQLDYVGVDAYFPISTETTPSLQAAMEGWEPWLTQLEAVSQKVDRPVLFTEYGYRSIDGAGAEPWQSNRVEGAINLEAQQVLLKALYESVWEQQWFAGGFVWKWFIDHHRVGGEQNNMFTPQNKPAQKLIGEYYGSY